MKKLITLITASLAVLVFVPSEARADSGCRRFVGHNHCGDAVYSVRRLVGYDCHGGPVYRWCTESVSRPRGESWDYGRDHFRPHHGGLRVHLPPIRFDFGHRSHRRHCD